MMAFRRAFALSLALIAAASLASQREASAKEKKTRFELAAEVVRNVDARFKGEVSEDGNLKSADCVVAFPKVVSGGLLQFGIPLGGTRARMGVASCRVGSAWSCPVAYDINELDVGIHFLGSKSQGLFAFKGKDARDDVGKGRIALAPKLGGTAGTDGRTARYGITANGTVVSAYSVNSKGVELVAVLGSFDLNIAPGTNEGLYGKKLDRQDAIEILGKPTDCPEASKPFIDALNEVAKRD